MVFDSGPGSAPLALYTVDFEMAPLCCPVGLHELGWHELCFADCAFISYIAGCHSLDRFVNFGCGPRLSSSLAEHSLIFR